MTETRTRTLSINMHPQCVFPERPPGQSSEWEQHIAGAFQEVALSIGGKYAIAIEFDRFPVDEGEFLFDAEDDIPMKLCDELHLWLVHFRCLYQRGPDIKTLFNSHIN